MFEKKSTFFEASKKGMKVGGYESGISLYMVQEQNYKSKSFQKRILFGHNTPSVAQWVDMEPSENKITGIAHAFLAFWDPESGNYTTIQ